MAVEQEDYAETSARLHDLMIRQLGAKGEDFPATFRHSGRLLPRKPRQAAQRIIETGAQIGNPKLARVTDHTGLAEDAARVERHLTRLNPQARRARPRANFAAGVAFQLVVIIALVIVVLRWRGLV